MLALVGSGLYRYLFAFSLNATSIHMLSGLMVVMATLMHLVHIRKPLLKHGRKILASPIKLGITLLLLGGLTLSVLLNVGPARWVMKYSYESRHRTTIFRPHEQVAYQKIGSTTRVHREATGISLLTSIDLNEIKDVVIAVWAESGGEMIEPLYLSPEVAYATHTDYRRNKVARKDLLPVFFDGYERMKKRVLKDTGEFDAVSSATFTGSFNLDSMLDTSLRQFSLMVEVNQLGDDNEHFSDREDAAIARMPTGVGVPSLIYQADIDLYEKTSYYLMTLSGISEFRDDLVSIGYETEGAGNALEIVEKVLIKVK